MKFPSSNQIQIQTTLKLINLYISYFHNFKYNITYKRNNSIENTITNITMNHSTSERVKMREKYKSKFNRDHIDDIEKYTKSDLCTLLTSIYKDPVEYDTDLLYKAMKGIGTNDDILIEVISFRNFQRLSKWFHIPNRFKNIKSYSIINII